MLPSTPSDKFCVPFSDKLHVSSLVKSPTTQSLHCPGLEAIPHEHPQHQDHGPYSGASFGHEITSTTKEKSPVNQPKVLGLPVKVFWVVMVGLVVILAGGKWRRSCWRVGGESSTKVCKPRLAKHSMTDLTVTAHRNQNQQPRYPPKATQVKLWQQ